GRLHKSLAPPEKDRVSPTRPPGGGLKTVNAGGTGSYTSVWTVDVLAGQAAETFPGGSPAATGGPLPVATSAAGPNEPPWGCRAKRVMAGAAVPLCQSSVVSPPWFIARAGSPPALLMSPSVGCGE